MRTRTTLACLAAAAAGLAGLASAASAATPTAAPDDLRASAVAHAQDALATHAGLVHSGPGQQFTQQRTTVESSGPAAGSSHVYFQRTYHGLAVLGGDVIVHQSASGAFRSASGTLDQDLTMGTTAKVSAQQAATTGKAHFTGAARSASPKLLVDALPAHAPRLAWDTLVTGTRPDQTPSRLHVLVDAQNGAVLDSWDEIETGTGHGFNVGTVTLNTTQSGSTFQLKDPTRGNNYTTDMNNGTSGNGTLFTDADDSWGDGTLSSRQTVAVDAQYGVAETWDFYKNTYGRNGIANNGAGSYNRVHYSSGYDNAFWDDGCFCMTYGDGDGTQFNPFASLDVAGHEMSHGVTANNGHGGLTYSGESGGLNESTSDVFGTMVEFFANSPADPPDFLIGEKIFKNGQPLRWMDDPAKDGNSATCWRSGVGNLDVHYSSGVGNHTFFVLSNGTGSSQYGNAPACNGAPAAAGIGRDKAAALWYRTVQNYTTSSETYARFRQDMLHSATDLYGQCSAEYQGVQAAFTASNIAKASGEPTCTPGGGPAVTNPGNQTGTVGSAVSLQLSASGGSAPYTWTASGLPAGLSISSSGLISGTPTTAGTSNVTVTVTDSASRTGSASFSWTVNPVGGGCAGAQLLGNPGFESGSASWTASSGVIGSFSGESAHSGSQFAWLDGYGTSHTDTLSQSVTVPAGCHASLSFWLHVDTDETTTATQFDTLTVQVGSSTVASYSNLNAASGYQQRTVEVSSFAGQTVTVKFTGVEDSSLQTSFVIDDTALNVS